ncbi:MAG: heavy-metal-associated domain-containing protein [Gammaproteobacteria bacterium]|nr:heavy-metal-associated domain-containing protein [Gammaproteobacteria bacterium]
MSTHIANVVVHIDENLSSEEIHSMEKEISMEGGVYSACVHERTPHLMVVDYDPMETRSLSLLRNVQSHGLHAELIGF